jgi:hypothetical protein
VTSLGAERGAGMAGGGEWSWQRGAAMLGGTGEGREG